MGSLWRGCRQQAKLHGKPSLDMNTEISTEPAESSTNSGPATAGPWHAEVWKALIRRAQRQALSPQSEHAITLK